MAPVDLWNGKADHQKRDADHGQSGNQRKAGGVLRPHLIESANDHQRDNGPEAGAADAEEWLFYAGFIIFDANVIAVVGGIDGGMFLMTEAEIVEGIDGTEGGGDGVIGKEEQRADHGENLRAGFGGGVDAAAVGVDSADVGIGPANAEDQQAHRGDEPHAGSPGNEEGEAQDVKSGSAPIAKEKPRGLEPVDVARPLTAQ